jgi:hypothetical protein
MLLGKCNSVRHAKRRSQAYIEPYTPAISRKLRSSFNVVIDASSSRINNGQGPDAFNRSMLIDVQLIAS